MALGDTRKDPCKYCDGPAGECTEIRGGFLPNFVCKKRPTYQQLWDELKVNKTFHNLVLKERNLAWVQLKKAEQKLDKLSATNSNLLMELHEPDSPEGQMYQSELDKIQEELKHEKSHFETVLSGNKIWKERAEKTEKELKTKTTEANTLRKSVNAFALSVPDLVERAEKAENDLEQKIKIFKTQSKRLQKDRYLHWKFAEWLMEHIFVNAKIKTTLPSRSLDEAWQEFRKESQD